METSTTVNLENKEEASTPQGVDSGPKSEMLKDFLPCFNEAVKAVDKFVNSNGSLAFTKDGISFKPAGVESFLSGFNEVKEVIAEGIKVSTPNSEGTKVSTPTSEGTKVSTSTPEEENVLVRTDVVGVRVAELIKSLPSKIVWEDEVRKSERSDFPAPESHSDGLYQFLITTIEVMKKDLTFGRRILITLVNGHFNDKMVLAAQLICPHACFNYQVRNEIEMVYGKKSIFNGVLNVMKEANPATTEDDLKYNKDGSVNELACELVRVRYLINVKELSFIITPLIGNEKWEDRSYPALAKFIADSIVWDK